MTLETKIPSREATGTASEALVAGVALFSHAPMRLVEFYERVLRTSFTHRVHEDGREHWIVAMGGIQLEIKALETAAGETTLDAFDSNEGLGHMSRSELSFQVPSVAAAVAQVLIVGGRVLQKAERFSWGTFAVVLDLDGNRLGLFQPPVTDSNSEEEQA